MTFSFAAIFLTRQRFAVVSEGREPRFQVWQVPQSRKGGQHVQNGAD